MVVFGPSPGLSCVVHLAPAFPFTIPVPTLAMSRFKGVDFYELDELYSEEERMVRDTLRDWVDAEFMPIIEEHNRDAKFPAHLVTKLGELGTLGASIEGYGCAGLSPVAYGLILQELERGDSGLRSFVSVQGSLCMYPIHAYGTEEQKQNSTCRGWPPAS